eukprot:Gb_02121 [translate_table: standard]
MIILSTMALSQPKHFSIWVGIVPATGRSPLMIDIDVCLQICGGIRPNKYKTHCQCPRASNNEVQVGIMKKKCCDRYLQVMAELSEAKMDGRNAIQVKGHSK